jgi:hypothetical protein
MCVPVDMICGVVVFSGMPMWTPCMSHLMFTNACSHSILLSCIIAKFVKTSRTTCAKINVCIHAINMCIPGDIEHVIAN